MYTIYEPGIVKYLRFSHHKPYCMYRQKETSKNADICKMFCKKIYKK